MIWFTISRFCQASTYVPLVDRAYFLNQWEQSTFIYISCTVYDMVVLKNFDSIPWSIYHRLHVKWRRLAVITIVAKLRCLRYSWRHLWHVMTFSFDRWPGWKLQSFYLQHASMFSFYILTILWFNQIESKIKRDSKKLVQKVTVIYV